MCIVGNQIAPTLCYSAKRFEVWASEKIARPNAFSRAGLIFACPDERSGTRGFF